MVALVARRSSRWVLWSGLCAGLFSFAAGGAAADTTLRLAHIWAADHPFNSCGAERMRELLADDPSGLRLRVYPAEQLGTMAQLADSIAAGNVDMSIFGASYLASRYEPLNVLDSVYVFRDYDHASQVINGEIGEKLWAGLLEKTGIRRVDNWLYGARHVTANKAVHGPGDMAGMKFRVPDNALMMANARALGTTPVPMAFGEVYLALQQGAIDGQENPLTVIETQKFMEVQKYLALTAHIIQVSPVVISERSWQKLDGAQRAALQRVVHEVTPEVKGCVLDSERELVDHWRQSEEITLIEPAEIDLDAFRQGARASILREYGDKWGDLYAQIQDFR